jgi:acetyl-CoA acetyltransferase/uncharacterized OB-fold protein
METSPTGRPLPQPTLASAGFWAAGADGVLHVQRCVECSTYQHPPMPRCRSCRSEKVQLAPVSGTGVVVGCTVNHQPWLATLRPPYVVAIVALDEDDGVRLTTNIVNCDPAAVHVGMRVKVTFEQAAEDIALPLFEPILGAEDGPLPEVPDHRRFLRPMVSNMKFEEKVAITGVGQSQVGRRLGVDPLSLTVDACLGAIEDAGLTLDDIDGLATYPGAGTSGGMTEGGITPLTEALQLKPTWISGGGDTPGQLGSVMSAMIAVASGLVRHVLCFRTLWESSYAELVKTGRWVSGEGRATGMVEFRLPFGAASAANWIGLQASHYLARYGVTREQVLAPIALNARANAAANPEAVYRDPLNLDDYVQARMITTPFGLYDCDVPVDGAVAVIVSAKETAADLRTQPVLVEAVGTQIMERLSWDQSTLTHMPQALGPAAHLWSRTDLKPEDVDVAELYDGFTFNCLSWMEGLGFCGFGEAADFLDGGRTIALDGTLPLNTHGGQLSAGRLHGYGFLREAVLQLRGEAPGRQVKDPKVAVVSAGGGVPSGAMLLRRE